MIDERAEIDRLTQDIAKLTEVLGTIAEADYLVMRNGDTLIMPLVDARRVLRETRMIPDEDGAL